MAITKVSQLARLSNSVLIQALTNRSYNNFGQMLGPEDIFEVSYKNGNNKTGYYSVGATVSDIRFDLVGKYSLGAVNDQNSVKPILTYDSKYANRYQEGDLLFYPKQNGLTLIRKTNRFDNINGTIAPNDNTIAPYGLANISDPNKNYQWQYAILPWDSWMVPLFSTIKTVGKIPAGYWQEVLPYKVFPEPIFTAAYGELTREFNSVINDSTKLTINNFNNISSATPSANSIYNINTAGVSAVYNFDTDRYILKIDINGKSESDISVILSDIAADCGSTDSNIKMPFFAFTVNSTDINYISVPYYTLNSTEPNKHIYCCLGNTVSADTTSYNISPVWAYEMIKNKETKLSSNTLNITHSDFKTADSRTGINIKTPIVPLSLTNNGNLQLNVGSGLKISNNALAFDDSALQALTNRVTTLDIKVTDEVDSLNEKINNLETAVNTTINTKIKEINTELERINALITANNRKLQTTLYGEASLS
jgi:hypothetical protein